MPQIVARRRSSRNVVTSLLINGRISNRITPYNGCSVRSIFAPRPFSHSFDQLIMPWPAGIVGTDYGTPNILFGGFRIETRPALGELKVKVRCNYDFTTNPNFGDAPWSPSEQANFKSSFRTLISTFWNGKWKLTCNAAGLVADLSPEIVIEEAAATSAHVRIKVGKGNGKSNLSPAGLLTLYQGDLLTIGQINAAARATGGSQINQVQRELMDSERTKVAGLGAFNTLKQFSLTRNGATWTIGATEQAALRTLATTLGMIPADSPRFAVYIHAESGATGKASDLVNTVHTYLRSNGIGTYPVITDPVKTRAKLKLPFSAHKATAAVSMWLDDDVDRTDASWDYPYCVAVHEFGHCLGLPDEYITYPADWTIAGAHDKWKALCTAATDDSGASLLLKMPPYPVKQLSIMSMGTTTTACHYVTIWDALVKATATQVSAADWHIERGSEMKSL